MNEALSSMLARYNCRTANDYENALKEIVQQICLLGLWRAKFFEHAAFYGGSSLRILYGIDRFSEDLDFSLLKPNPKFQLERYANFVKDELSSFGFDVEVKSIQKKEMSAIQSAFIKLGTLQNFVSIGIPTEIQKRTQHNAVLKVKFEVDTNPPGGFSTEAKTILQPIPFSVNSYCLPDLFAGKVHAILCRGWKDWVKGRDWYDFVWFIGREYPLSLNHLKARLIQTKNWSANKPLDKPAAIQLLRERISNVDFEAAKADVKPFLREPKAIDLWSKAFFLEILERLEVQ